MQRGNHQYSNIYTRVYNIQIDKRNNEIVRDLSTNNLKTIVYFAAIKIAVCIVKIPARLLL